MTAYEIARKELATFFTPEKLAETRAVLGSGKKFKDAQKYASGKDAAALKKMREIITTLQTKQNTFTRTTEAKQKREKIANNVMVKSKVKNVLDNYPDRTLIELTNTQGVTRYVALNASTRGKLNEIMETGSIQSSHIEADILSFSDSVINEIFVEEKFKPSGIKVVDKNISNFVDDDEDEPKKVYKKKSGKFFKYYSLVDFDFSKYGVLKEFNAEYYKNNCFYHALKAHGLDEVKLNALKYIMKDSHISICKLNDVCKALDISLELHHERDNANHKIVLKYGDQKNEYIKIGLIDDHYFIIDQVEITSYALKNYDEVKHIKGFNNIYKQFDNKYKKCKDRYIDSFEAIRLLIQHKDKLLKPITLDADIMKTPYYKRVDQTIQSLDYHFYDIGAVFPPAPPKKEPYKVFFDFESVTTGDIHEAYMVHYCSENDQKTKCVKAWGKDVGLFFLHKVTEYVPEGKELCLIAHNMRYDLSFVSRFLYSIDTCKAGGKIISVKGYFNKRVVHLRDSYAMIPMPLRDFAKCFSLQDVKKEIINYDFYNREIPNMNMNAINDEANLYSVDEAMNTYYKNDAETFLKNIDEWNIHVGDKYNALKYASKYCSQDVLTLKKGYETFREWIMELYNIDIAHMYSISGLAHTVLVNEGCYEGCWKMGGVIRHFISNAVVGGRVMISDNKKKYRGPLEKINFEAKDEIEELKNVFKDTDKISDFDGVSLYPSSMARIPGFIKGQPIPFYGNVNLSEYDYYFVEIKITKVGIDRHFSLVSEMTEDGVREFKNTVVGNVITVDKITLEDLVEFQKVEYEIIRGYGFNEGFNPKVNEVIKMMFNERLKMKAIKNPIQIVYKLLMNSAYGRTIMKEQDNEEKYFNSKQKALEYMERHYNSVIECRQLQNDTKYYVKIRKEIQSHTNSCHNGAMVLSMSKRIMNEVICTAEDNDIEIFYQDTDSMHLFEKDIERLRSIYNEKYGRELIGENLGQFHTDFAMSEKDVGEVSSQLCIMLGKKCYVDVLKGDKKDVFECHTRLKGVSAKSLNYTAKKLYNHNLEVMNLIHLYKDLYDGKKIEFDLTCNGSVPTFETFDLLVRTRPEFKREIKF